MVILSTTVLSDTKYILPYLVTYKKIVPVVRLGWLAPARQWSVR